MPEKLPRFPRAEIIQRFGSEPYPRGAAVCLSGHVLSMALGLGDPDPVSGFCHQCGSRVLARCEVCHRRLRGDLYLRGFRVDKAERPEACDLCGALHPWSALP